MSTYKNATKAFIKIIKSILNEGHTVQGRGGETKELRSELIKIKKPLERVYVIQGRNNNIFATIAETIWAIAGHDDMDYLAHYLRRAPEFSDDGRVWRAAYGPRLRNWYGVDQITEVYRLLKENSMSRRAVMVIFDPARDYQDSKDIPCNNWLQFLIRDGRLHMNVVVRSNDIMWGFSGINTFEWSVLHEMMGFWLEIPIGDFSYFVSSLHLYERHYEQAQTIVSAAKHKTLYDFGITHTPFGTPLSDLDAVLKIWFAIEQELRVNPTALEILERINHFPDPFLRNCLEILRIYNIHKLGTSREKIVEALNALPINDLKLAAIEYFMRSNPKFIEPEGIASDYFSYFQDEKHSDREISFPDIWNLLRILHNKKSLVYGDSWKRRGEVLSIFANISRKYDRLEAIVEGGLRPTSDETMLDTLADLGIYAAKYLTYLAEQYEDITREFINQYMPDTDIEHYKGNSGLNAISELLIDRYHHEKGIQHLINLSDCYATISQAYELLTSILIDGDWRVTDPRKCQAAADLSNASIHTFFIVAMGDRDGFERFKTFVEEL